MTYASANASGVDADGNSFTLNPDGTKTTTVLNPDGSPRYAVTSGADGKPISKQVISGPGAGTTVSWDSNGHYTTQDTAGNTINTDQANSDASGIGGETWGDAVVQTKDVLDSANIVGHPFVSDKQNEMLGGKIKAGVNSVVSGDGGPNFGTGSLFPDGAVAGVGGGSGGGGSGSGSGDGSGGVVGAVNDVAHEAFDYADKNRDFQLSGLDKANAALDPAKASYASMYGPGGSLTGPGQGEQAFTSQGGNLLNPTEQGKALATASPFLSGQSPGMSAYQDVAGQLSGPTLSGQTYGQYAGQLGQASAGEQRYGATAGKYDTNALSQAAPGFQNQLAQQSAGEQRYADTAGKYDTNSLDQAAGGLNAKLTGATNLESSLGSIAGKYAAPSASSTTYQQQSGQLGGPGSLEQFAASDMAGTNPYYKQLAEQQSADIDASMNARGGFNSGAALKAQALGRSNLAAQQYQQEGQLQGAAQTAQMSRLGQQQSAAGAADTANYASLAGQTSALGTADAQRLARTQSGIDLAGQQASTNLGYLSSGQQAANSAGAASLARTQAGIGLANQQSTQDLNYLQGGQTAANAASAQNLARTQAGIDLTKNTDATNLAQNLGYVGAANSAGAGQVSQYGQLASMAQGQDAASQTQYMNYLSSAAAAQKAAQDRQQQGFTDATATGAIQAANTTGQYGKAGDEYASMVGAGMGAQLNAAQLAAQQAMNDKNATYGLYGTIFKGLLD
jgi:hypothetical protein